MNFIVEQLHYYFVGPPFIKYSLWHCFDKLLQCLQFCIVSQGPCIATTVKNLPHLFPMTLSGGLDSVVMMTHAP